jgi:hypothetical protein
VGDSKVYVSFSICCSISPWNLGWQQLWPSLMQASQQTGDQAQLNCILMALKRLLLDPNKRVREVARMSLALLTEASAEKLLPQVPCCASDLADGGGSACGRLW